MVALTQDGQLVGKGSALMPFLRNQVAQGLEETLAYPIRSPEAGVSCDLIFAAQNSENIWVTIGTE